ncbi:MAG: HAMP domain-containing sensor histidine kinase [Microbacterium sp.]
MDPVSRWWRRLSLRAKVTGATVFVLALGLITVGFVAYPLLRANLVATVDSSVEEYASSDSFPDRLVKLLEAADGSINFVLVTNPPQTEYYIAMYDQDGQLQVTAGGPGEESETDDPPAFPQYYSLSQAFIDDGEIVTIPSASGQGSGYRATVRFKSLSLNEGDVNYTMVVAVPLVDVDAFTKTYVSVFTIVSLAMLLVGALLTRGIVTLTFRRFGHVEATAMQIAAGDFTQRMDDIEPSTEIGRLKIAINTMLDRLDEAIDERDATVAQMRRFVGDASHELRTPLVSVRGYAELYRMGAMADDEAVTKAMERIEAEAKRMGVLVEDLLALTRLDEKREIDLHPVDLRPLARDAALDLRAADPTRLVSFIDHSTDSLTEPISIPVTEAPEPDSAAEGRRRGAPGAWSRAARRLRRDQGTEVPQLEIPPAKPMLPVAVPPVVLGDEDKIRQLMANLLGNARRYSPDDAPIAIEVGVDSAASTGWMAIVDHGEGVPAPIREKIFQRFWRADTSRARETGGSGLGLAIVASIVDSMHGSVTVGDTPGGGATFRISLPLAPTSRSQQPISGVSPSQPVESAPPSP